LTKNFKNSAIAALVLGFLGGHQANAEQSVMQMSNEVAAIAPVFQPAVVRHGALQTAEIVLAPFGHVQFCLRRPESCKSTSTADVFDVDAARLAELDDVNRSINRRIRPQSKRHLRHVGGYWEVNPAAGDCNDFAVSKREELIRRGWPSHRLLLSAVRTATGEEHLVLVVRSDRGDLVLDNLARSVRPWSQTGYEWLIIQSDEDPNTWVAVADQMRVVASGPGDGFWLEGPVSPVLRGSIPG
jgi:predicted transglutaminase-like cysteine proteinase